MDPSLQHGSALRGVVVRDAVGPFSDCRLDEALGLAVGLRPVGSGEAVLDLQITACGGELLGAEGRAVVGEQAPGSHAQGLEVSDGVLQELHGVRLALVSVHVGEADAGMVIDGNEQELPASTLEAVAPVAGDAVAHALDATEFLGVNVNQIARVLMLVAHNRLGGLKIPQAGEPGTGEHAAHGALGHADRLGDARLGEASAAQFHDRQGLGRTDGIGADLGAGGPVDQAELPMG